MQELIDLTKILEVGDEIYDAVFDRKCIVRDIDLSQELPILVAGVNSGANRRRYSKCGSLISIGKDCYLFPSKENTDWEGYQSPVKVFQYDIVLVSNEENGNYQLGIFSHKDDEGKYHVFSKVDIENNLGKVETTPYNYLKDVPFECGKFFYTKLGNRGFKKNVVAKITRLKENGNE